MKEPVSRCFLVWYFWSYIDCQTFLNFPLGFNYITLPFSLGRNPFLILCRASTGNVYSKCCQDNKIYLTTVCVLGGIISSLLYTWIQGVHRFLESCNRNGVSPRDTVNLLPYLLLDPISSFKLEPADSTVYSNIIICILLLLLSLRCLCKLWYMQLFQLWVGPGSKAAQEKQFFDSHLSPFYRIEQVLLCHKFLSLISRHTSIRFKTYVYFMTLRRPKSSVCWSSHGCCCFFFNNISKKDNFIN